MLQDKMFGHQQAKNVTSTVSERYSSLLSLCLRKLGL